MVGVVCGAVVVAGLAPSVAGLPDGGVVADFPPSIGGVVVVGVAVVGIVVVGVVVVGDSPCAARSECACSTRMLVPVISRITAWWTRRSMAAAVVIGSLKIRSHSLNTRLLVWT